MGLWWTKPEQCCSGGRVERLGFKWFVKLPLWLGQEEQLEVLFVTGHYCVGAAASATD